MRSIEWKDSTKRHERSDKLRAKLEFEIGTERNGWVSFTKKGLVGLKKGKPTVNYIEEHVSHT